MLITRIPLGIDLTIHQKGYQRQLDLFAPYSMEETSGRFVKMWIPQKLNKHPETLVFDGMGATYYHTK